MALEKIGARAVLEGLGPFLSGTRRMQGAVGDYGASADRAASKTSLLSRAASGAGGVAHAFTAALKTVSIAALAAGAAIAAVGTAAVVMAAKFEQSMSLIIGLVGIERDQVKSWEKDILSLSRETGKSAQELSDALFFITSAGLRGSEAIDALTASAQASVAGLGETKVIADAVTSAMNAYGASNLSAERATAILVAAVREGKAEASAFAPVLGALLPFASELGVGFDQVAAAIAAMTRVGLDAARSATAVRGMFAKLLKPIPARVGLSAEELRKELREKGLLPLLALLKQRFEGNEEAMSLVFEDVEALLGVLTLTGSQAKTTEEIFASLAGTTEKDLDKAFRVATDTVGFKFQRALNSIKVLMLDLGLHILPLAIPFLDQFARAMALIGRMMALPDVGRAFAGIGEALAPISVAVRDAISHLGMLALRVRRMATEEEGGVADLRDIFWEWRHATIVWAKGLWEGAEGEEGIKAHLQDALEKIRAFAMEKVPEIARAYLAFRVAILGALIGLGALMLTALMEAVVDLIRGSEGQKSQMAQLGSDLASTLVNAFAAGLRLTAPIDQALEGWRELFRRLSVPDPAETRIQRSLEGWRELFRRLSKAPTGPMTLPEVELPGPGFQHGGLIRRPSLISDLATGFPVGVMAERAPEAIVPVSSQRVAGRSFSSSSFFLSFGDLRISVETAVEARDAVLRKVGEMFDRAVGEAARGGAPTGGSLSLV